MLVPGIFYFSAKGKLKEEEGQEIDLDSTFWGFSCTKLLTTIAVLQCVENGLIALDDPVDGVLPELREPNIITPELSGSFKLTPAKNKITLRHLVAHTSGLSYDAMHPILVAWRESRGESPQVMSGKMPEAHSLPLLFEPGSSWVYGAGLDWAGLLVERLNNTRLAAYMQKRLFKPLGLESSTFRPYTRPDIMANLAQMWRRSDEGELIPVPSPYPLYARNDSGGMGLVTSTSDLIAILQDLLKDKPVLLKKESVTEMFTPQFEPGTPQHRGVVEQESLHNQLTGDTTGNAEVSFGLGGLVVQKDVPNLPAKTLTWNGMPNIGWFVNLDRGLGGMYVSQVLPPGDPKSVDLLGEFWREIWAQHAVA
ncbi:hypothetical protein J7T55_007714 [Diaporthe amygdali]|uniref:uncharacterized protein n=1 Tax=Phomopsis amygdali TaxID=1214568 RepID=UPI0022FEDBC1|nr:uncharacterized protein J7T55_007714 [Diaporthe amygdali]KAJ0107525.1 hypothetical protein J7T55_007714 [Diaporthe amygdali]